MKKNRIIIISVVALLVAVGIVIALIFTRKSNSTQISNPDEFKEYISAYSPNIISKNDVIVVQLSEDLAEKVKETKNDVLEISPNISGKITWKDERTIEFKPDAALESGIKYTVSLNLKKLNSEVESDKKYFRFNVNVKNQFINVKLDRVNTTDLQHFTKQDIYYSVKLNDIENIEDLKACFSFSKDVKFDLEKNNDTDYTLIARNVTRTSNKSELTLNYDGKNISSKSNGSLILPILPTDVFDIIDISISQYPEQYVNVVFSDPINEQQYLDGLIKLGDEKLKFLIIDNVIKIIPVQKLLSEYQLSIAGGVKNVQNKKLSEKTFKQKISFSLRKPELRKKGNESILPSVENKQIITFDAVNVKAVDVRVTRIYQNNILQFLQENDISDDYQLNRVGKAIALKTIDLQKTNVQNFDQWNTFFIDISDIIRIEPGAIYKIELNFRQKNAIYTSEEMTGNDVDIIEKDDDWSWFDNYTYYPENFNYDYDEYYYEDNNNDPAKYSYYGYKNAVKFSILASNVGLIAKKGTNNCINAFVSDILTAEAVKGATIEIYDYQQQLIGSAITSQNGDVEITLDKKDNPHFVVATNKGQKAYLKLEDYKSLYNSKFDVSGNSVQNGTKAFIYAERGVWRPGDSIFVGFIVNETLEKIPVGMPISFEVRNSRNQVIYQEVQSKNDKGFHVFKFNTDINAPTGYYSAIIKFGGQTFSKSLMIETIKPNRLNIQLDFSQKYLSGDGSVKANLDVSFLFGGAAANLDFTTNVTFGLKYTPFKKFENYCFQNNAVNYNFETTNILNGTTDENGKYSGAVKFQKMKNAPGVLNANLSTKVFEKGGNINIAEKFITYHPYNDYIGMKSNGNYRINKNIKFDFVAVDRDEKLVTDSKKVEFSIYKMEDYWWYEYSDNNVDFITANYNNSVYRENISFSNGKGNTTYTFDDGGYYYIAAKNLSNGQVVSQQIYVSNYDYDDEYDYSASADSPEIINFKADKDVYQVGETVNVSIPLGVGNALISIENSSKVLKAFWQKTEKNKLNFSFKVEKEMTPNVYINVCFIQPHENSNNDVPLRVYGIIPIAVENAETHLLPKIDMPNELPAESKIKVTVSETNGQTMTYTIAMVDEGLLALTSFKTPNPWDSFYAKEALGVKTWDIFDNVIKSFAIDANRLLSIGGDFDEKLSAEDLKQANRFKPMVKFYGPFTIGKNKSKTHEIQLPQYVGAVRTMVVAANDNSAFGCAEKTTPVTKPLMVLGTAPRKISTNETFKLPVTVFAMKADIQNVAVSVKTNNKIKIIGNSTQNIKFSKTGEKYIDFEIKALEKGVATIEITATCGTNVSSYNIEMDVTYVNTVATDVIDGIVGAENFETNFIPNGIKGTNEAYIELYAIPPLNLEARLNYLIAYPHGCIEQIVSAAFPQIHLDNLTEIDDNQKTKIQKNITACISRLSKYQTSDGGFAYWAGGSYSSEWGSTYAGHFMIEAEKAGYNVPSSLKSNWLKHQKNRTTKWYNDGAYAQIQQAYRLYTMALAGSEDRSAMNRLKETKINNLAGWYLAAAYAVSGKTTIAKEIITKLSTSVNNYTDLSGTFGSTLRDKALILEVLTTVNQKTEAFPVLKQVAEIIGSKAYCNTQATAYALIAVSKYVKTFNISNQINCSYNINGKEFTAKTSKSVLQTKINIIDAENHLIIKTPNSDMLYVRLILKGIPEAGEETSVSSNITMTVKYTNLDGKTIDFSNLSQGTDFIAHVTLRHSNQGLYTLNNVALTQIFPSGWEITNSRMSNVDLGESSYFEYQDIRDDRVLTYFDMSRNRDYNFKVLLTASYAGEFYLPAVSCETMYDNANIARVKGQFVKVINN